jgi:hypothetical protein
MTDRIKRDTRARMAVTGESYTRARRAAAAQAAAAATGPELLLAPYPDEDGVTAGELGWRVLPADATPGQRAHAEAVWRPVTAGRPCRCCGPCHHGEACGEERTGDDGRLAPCGGRMVHVDRYPGSMLELSGWEDVYRCDTCDEDWTASIDLPAVPWGERRTDITVVFPGVRHPNFPGTYEDDWDDGVCPDCGNGTDDRCTCYEDHGCPECGAGGAGDPYGECVCYPE